MLVTMLAVFTVSATSASMARFVVEDDSFGSGDEIVRLKVLRNTQSGEKVESCLLIDFVVWPAKTTIPCLSEEHARQRAD